jgi:NAD(P)H dehydrogenase (quinone)
MLRAAKEVGVGHVIYTTLQRREGSTVKIPEVTDVENVAEAVLMNSGLTYTIVRNTLYTHGIKRMFSIEDIFDRGVRTFGPEGKTTYARLEDLAEVAANLLLQGGHENKVYTLNAGESLSVRQIAALLSKIYGAIIECHLITKSEYIDDLITRGRTPKIAEYGAEFVNAIAEGEFSEISTSLEQILGRKPESFREALLKDLTEQNLPA